MDTQGSFSAVLGVFVSSLGPIGLSPIGSSWDALVEPHRVFVGVFFSAVLVEPPRVFVGC